MWMMRFSQRRTQRRCMWFGEPAAGAPAAAKRETKRTSIMGDFLRIRSDGNQRSEVVAIRLPDPWYRPLQGRPNAGGRPSFVNAVATPATALL